MSSPQPDPPTDPQPDPPEEEDDFSQISQEDQQSDIPEEEDKGIEIKEKKKIGDIPTRITPFRYTWFGYVLFLIIVILSFILFFARETEFTENINVYNIGLVITSGFVCLYFCIVLNRLGYNFFDKDSWLLFFWKIIMVPSSLLFPYLGLIRWISSESKAFKASIKASAPQQTSTGATTTTTDTNTEEPFLQDVFGTAGDSSLPNYINNFASGFFLSSIVLSFVYLFLQPSSEEIQIQKLQEQFQSQGQSQGQSQEQTQEGQAKSKEGQDPKGGLNVYGNSSGFLGKIQNLAKKYYEQLNININDMSKKEREKIFVDGNPGIIKDDAEITEHLKNKIKTVKDLRSAVCIVNKNIKNLESSVSNLDNCPYEDDYASSSGYNSINVPNIYDLHIPK